MAEQTEVTVKRRPRKEHQDWLVESLSCVSDNRCKYILSLPLWKRLKQRPPQAYHTLSAHADAVRILVGAARAVMHQLFHIRHISRLLGLAVQVATFICWERERERERENEREWERESTTTATNQAVSEALCTLSYRTTFKQQGHKDIFSKYKN